MFRIKRIDWGTRFEALAGALAAPARALKQIGSILASRSKDRMVNQGEPKGSWAPRAVPNIPGILRDFHSGGAAPKPRRFQDRPAVFDSNELFRQIGFALTSPTRVEVGVAGSAQNYVDLQHFGGESKTDPNTPEFKEWLYRWLKTSAGKPWAGALGYLLNKARLGPETWNVKSRPIFVLTGQDIEDIAELAGVEIVAEAQTA